MGGKYQSNLHELNMPSMEDAWSQSDYNNKMGHRQSESNISLQKVSEEHVLKGDEIGKFFLKNFLVNHISYTDAQGIQKRTRWG